jgi:hypothetical protein
MTDRPEYWTLETMAADLGVQQNALQVIHARSVHRRNCRVPGCMKFRVLHASGNVGSRCQGKGPRRGDLPPPELRLGGRPAWTDESYQQWKASRPGSGKHKQR